MKYHETNMNYFILQFSHPPPQTLNFLLALEGG